MNDLTERKRILILRGELYRQSIELERIFLRERLNRAREGVHTHRWWMVGLTAVAGWFARRKAGGVFRWLPAVATLWRVVQTFGRR